MKRVKRVGRSALWKATLGGTSGLTAGMLISAFASLASPGTLAEKAAFVLAAPPWCLAFLVGGPEGLLTATYFAMAGVGVAFALARAGSSRYVCLTGLAVVLAAIHLASAALLGKLIFGGPGGFFGSPS